MAPSQGFVTAHRLVVLILTVIMVSACGGGSNDSSGSSASTPSSSGASGSSGSVTLSWTRPTLNTDGSELTDLSGYRVLYGRDTGNLDQSEWITDASIISYEVKNLSAGTWYFAMVSVNAAGGESDPTGVVAKTIG